MGALTYLRSLNACPEAIAWVESRPVERQDLASLWRDCPRGDWMLWLATRVEAPDRASIGAAAWACAHLAEAVAAGADAAYAAIAAARVQMRGDTADMVRLLVVQP